MSYKTKGAARANYDHHIYALYRGDTFLMDGTLDEIAEARGVKRRTLQYMLRPVYRRKTEGRTKYGNDKKWLTLTLIE